MNIFENLNSEILFNIFEYLSDQTLFDALFGFNHRVNSIIIGYRLLRCISSTRIAKILSLFEFKTTAMQEYDVVNFQSIYGSR